MIPVLGISIVVLLVLASGCIGTMQSKEDLRNLSNGTLGTQTPVTIVPTGTESTETTETMETSTRPVPTGLDDVCVFGSKNCHLYEQCTNNCLKAGTSPEDCAKVCCNTKCFDLPTQDEKVACSKVCLAKLSQPTPTPTPKNTIETLAPLSTPDTLAPLEQPTLVPL
jgi:hypothetical protein